MDTDSLYLGLAAKNLYEAVMEYSKPEFVDKLEGRCRLIHVANAETFFLCICHRDILFDKMGGLFKEKMTGSEMVALCLKMYVIE